VSRGVLIVRRSDNAMKRNAEVGLFTKPSKWLNHPRNGRLRQACSARS